MTSRCPPSLLAFLAAAASSSSCGGDDEEQPPPPPTVSLSALCAESAKAECERLSACGVLAPPLDAAACQARHERALCQPKIAPLAAAVAAGEVAYDESQGQKCKEAIRARPCATGLVRDPLALPECVAAFSGKKEAGKSCLGDAYCTAGLYCSAFPEGCSGECGVFRQNNEPCGIGEAPCAPNLFCSLTAMRCRAPAALGATCEGSLYGNACAAGSFCDMTNPLSARCVAARGRRTACRSPYECAEGLSCIRNLCSGGEDGDLCESDEDCIQAAVCSGGKCRIPLARDAACMTMGGAPCREDTTCTSSQAMTLCRARKAAGDACQMSAECYLGRCDMGRCASPVLDGAACSGAADCLPGRTCDGTCKPAGPMCN